VFENRLLTRIYPSRENKYAEAEKYVILNSINYTHVLYLASFVSRFKTHPSIVSWIVPLFLFQWSYKPIILICMLLVIHSALREVNFYFSANINVMIKQGMT
jgi:hypothetical protein